MTKMLLGIFLSQPCFGLACLHPGGCRSLLTWLLCLFPSCPCLNLFPIPPQRCLLTMCLWPGCSATESIPRVPRVSAGFPVRCPPHSCPSYLAFKFLSHCSCGLFILHEHRCPVLLGCGSPVGLCWCWIFGLENPSTVQSPFSLANSCYSVEAHTCCLSFWEACPLTTPSRLGPPALSVPITPTVNSIIRFVTSHKTFSLCCLFL